MLALGCSFPVKASIHPFLLGSLSGSGQWELVLPRVRSFMLLKAQKVYVIEGPKGLHLGEQVYLFVFGGAGVASYLSLVFIARCLEQGSSLPPTAVALSLPLTSDDAPLSFR